jgi:hypothetical protein
MKNPSEQLDEAAVAASATCTRSGAFALLLSLALFTMIPYWLHRGEQVALLNYVTLRESLAGTVELLDGSVNWKTYRASNPEAESMTIAELLKVQVEGAPVGKSGPQQVSGAATVPQGAPALKPAPPSNVQLSIVSTIDELPFIADALVKLDDSQLLTKSRNVSIFYNNSIYRWAIKRQALLLHHAGAASGGVVWQAPPDPNQPPNFVPSWGKDLLLNNLTISDVRELATFELPPLSDTTSIGAGEREIDVSPGSLPRTLFAATLSAESLLLFVVIFFGAFAREVACAKSFPVAGTVFSAFAKSRGTLLVFGLTLCMPVIASVGILLTSQRWEFMLLAALIGYAVFWVFLVLQRKHYFWGKLAHALAA